MTSETPELLACPFCGSHDLTPTSQGGDSHWIMCISCKAEGPWAGAADDARTLWDRRAFPSSPPIKASVSGLIDKGLIEWSEHGFPPQWRLTDTGIAFLTAYAAKGSSP